MTDEVRLNKSEGIVEVVSSGVLTKKDMESTEAKLQKILAEKGVRRILIDTTQLESAPSTIDIFDAGKNHFKGFKIAFLVSESSPIIDDVVFAETVGVNRSEIVKIFTDREEARQWLVTSADD